MSSTGDLFVATIFNWVVCIWLAHALARVALALHFAQRSTPLGVTTKDQITKLQVMSVVTNVYFGLALRLAQQPKLLHFGNVPDHSLYPKLPLAHPVHFPNMQKV